MFECLDNNTECSCQSKFEKNCANKASQSECNMNPSDNCRYIDNSAVGEFCGDLGEEDKCNQFSGMCSWQQNTCTTVSKFKSACIYNKPTSVEWNEKLCCGSQGCNTVTRPKSCNTSTLTPSIINSCPTDRHPEALFVAWDLQATQAECFDIDIDRCSKNPVCIWTDGQCQAASTRKKMSPGTSCMGTEEEKTTIDSRAGLTESSCFNQCINQDPKPSCCEFVPSDNPKNNPKCIMYGPGSSAMQRQLQSAGGVIEPLENPLFDYARNEMQFAWDRIGCPNKGEKFSATNMPTQSLSCEDLGSSQDCMRNSLTCTWDSDSKKCQSVCVKLGEEDCTKNPAHMCAWDAENLNCVSNSLGSNIARWAAMPDKEAAYNEMYNICSDTSTATLGCTSKSSCSLLSQVECEMKDPRNRTLPPSSNQLCAWNPKNSQCMDLCMDAFSSQCADFTQEIFQLQTVCGEATEKGQCLDKTAPPTSASASASASAPICTWSQNKCTAKKSEMSWDICLSRGCAFDPNSKACIPSTCLSSEYNNKMCTQKPDIAQSTEQVCCGLLDGYGCSIFEKEYQCIAPCTWNKKNSKCQGPQASCGTNRIDQLNPCPLEYPYTCNQEVQIEKDTGAESLNLKFCTNKKPTIQGTCEPIISNKDSTTCSNYYDAVQCIENSDN